MAPEQDVVAEALPAYEVGDELGRGGTGIVLAGVHRSLGREVAIKQLPREFGANPDHRMRFVQEARTLASFDHPHIVPIFDYVEHDGVCLLVMERLTGGTVWDRMHAGDGLSPLKACGITLAACAGLHYAHEKHTLHRDVKPENLMFSASGTLKITDFGIAKVMGSVSMATQAGLVVGTPAYISPEQAQSGELGPWTDVYALGTLLYELLAKQLPYKEVTDQVVFLYQHVHEDPAPLLSTAPWIPAPVAAVVDRAIQRDPANRYATAEDFGTALAAAASDAWGSDWLHRSEVVVMGAGRMLQSTDTDTDTDVEDDAVEPAPSVPSVPSAPPSAGGSPNRGRLVAALVVLALLVVGGLVLLVGGGDDDDGAEATTTTTSTAPPEDRPIGVANTTLAGALALSLDDLPDGFEQRALGGVIDPDLTDDPCLATLPEPYDFQAAGDSFGNDEPGLEVSSTVALTGDPEAAAANAAALGGDAFLECVREAVSASVDESVESVTLDRTEVPGVAGYVTSWVIEARTGAGAGFVESVVLTNGRAVVTVNFSSTDGRVSEEFRSAVLASVGTRLLETAQ